MSNNARFHKIDSLDREELQIFGKIREIQLKKINEPAPGIFIAESPKTIARALDAGYEPISILMEEKHIETEGRHILERTGNIPVYYGAYELLKQITGFELTRGMLMAMKRKPLHTVEQVVRDANRIAVLENVVNPTNLGAIIRSAAALGIDAVLLTHPCVDPLYRRSIRVSMGCVFQIPWTYIPKEIPLDQYVTKILKPKFKTVAFALKDDSVAISDEVLHTEEPLAIIMGTEGEGLMDSTIEQCDYTVKIPMYHGVDSLNVAAASALAFWELCK